MTCLNGPILWQEARVGEGREEGAGPTVRGRGFTPGGPEGLGYCRGRPARAAEG